jgi:monofunctional biosynthetic peptidoglycan transglycosylase
VARPGPDGAEPADLAGGGRGPALPDHNGFDLQAIEKARDHNAKGGRLRGASTISQQVAKNLFLWQGRSWIRKGLEVWYTVLIEALWPKERILEMYANIAEFGDGVYGAQAAAQKFWGKDAARLSPAERAAGGGAAGTAALQRGRAGAVCAAARGMDPAPGAAAGGAAYLSED